eukprot:Sspe_Gene.9392::Locus_3155_Transcript_1_1_Confidence_1.000_Length_1531::g.9392::m.9392/K03844/ALG11; alpha-1,2-mannosyltransferase
MWLWFLLLGVVLLVVGFVAWVALLAWHLRGVRAPSPKVIGFFHPYSTGGGGGERVLWTMVDVLQRNYPDYEIVVYTKSMGKQELTPDTLSDILAKKFGIKLERPVKLCTLRHIHWVEASSYPRLTLLLQSLGAIPLSLEAITARVPHVWIDTMGYAMTYPVARYLAGCQVISYTHYPTVSTDMLDAVSSRRVAHNNPAWVARSALISTAKVLYYKSFAVLYGWAGRRCDSVMVNSSWTRGHIEQIWRTPAAKLFRVYPPCDCKNLLGLKGAKEKLVISVAQFRPEKDHTKQLEAFALLRQRCPGVQLHLVGGVRDEEDRQRVEMLKANADRLGVAGDTHFHVDLPYGELLKLLDRALIGLHTMWNEHFGIGVVEYMAAGCVPVAHRSGGPLMDIVSAESGFLADTPEEYADAMEKILNMDASALGVMQAEARRRSQGFSVERFEAGVLEATRALL